MSEAHYALLAAAARTKLHAPAVLVCEYVPRNIFTVRRSPPGFPSNRRRGMATAHPTEDRLTRT